MILPLDSNIYLHQICGIVIFILSWIHTIMHLINLGVNIQPNPVKFVQMTNKFWAGYKGRDSGLSWENLRYHVPDGCSVVEEDLAGLCLPDSFDPDNPDIKFCQSCLRPDFKEYSYYDWLFTTKPHCLGLIDGWAFPTGIALIITITVMYICAMPCVRRSGHFEAFYFSHLLYIAYFVLLIIHAPDFWMWIVGPGTIFLVEVTYRFLSTVMGAGWTKIEAADLLPFDVTALLIRRPPNFVFAPGDWVFVKIPAIAKAEWHPFTISSAPEKQVGSSNALS